MLLQYCSDLHLEFDLNEKYMKKYPLQVKGDILLLAGDIVLLGLIDRHKFFFDFLADNFAHTYWIPGNHEYYHNDIADRGACCNEQIRSNISLVNNVSIDLPGIQLICSTLWSRISPVNEWQIERAMSDFHTIKNNGKRFSVSDFNQLHTGSLAFIRQALTQESPGTRVVMTHHIPTFMHYPAVYKNDVVSEAFVTELSDIIEPSGIHSWIYGHHHANTADFKLGNTNLLTNQLGYVKYGEHRDFDHGKVISVPAATA